ncbi:hypothetical protein [Bradyrhizobium sp. NBAIM01]|uniref:hypothetical protein n=1 Tax=Bradyrhizobium sp. NBAIM01 TaxID=2793818 RepID=UPI001CD73049|nr:hypothetical protein [Bradyrhizobium sp. NBAIM01]
MRQLVLLASDDLIAGHLNGNSLKSGNGNRWTRERVTSMRSNYHMPMFIAAEEASEPWLNLEKAEKLFENRARRSCWPLKSARSHLSILCRRGVRSSPASR